MNGAVGLEHDVAEVFYGALTPLSKGLVQVGGAQPRTPQTCGQKPAVMDQEHGRPTNQMAQARRAGQQPADRRVQGEEHTSADESGSQAGVARDHGCLDGTSEQQNGDQIGNAQLGERPPTDRAEADDEERKDGTRMNGDNQELHRRQSCSASLALSGRDRHRDGHQC